MLKPFRVFSFGIMVMCRERRRMAEAVLKLEYESQDELLRLIFSTSTSAFLAADVGGRILMMNPAAIGCLRIRDPNVKGKLLWEVVPGAEALLQGKIQGEQRSTQLRFPDGNLVTLGFSTTLIEEKDIRIVVFRELGEVTERVRMKAKLVLYEERIRRTFESMTSGVLVTDDAGVISLVNPAALKFLQQVAPESLVGKSLGDVIPGSEVLLCETRSGEQLTATVMLKDGAKGTIGYTTTIIPQDGQRIIVFRDVTKTLEMDQRRSRAEQLAQVGEVAAKLSHDIKNPIASVLAGLQILERDRSLLSESKVILQTVIEEVRTLSKAVGVLLDSARPRPISPKPTNIITLMRSCFQANVSMAKRMEVTLHLLEPRENIVANVDEQAMNRVLSNLVQNALEACSPQEQVWIGWRKLDNIEKATLFPGFPGEVVSIFVEDEGPGIPKEVLGNIFKPFFTTKKTGTGLGLSVVHDLVISHGGLIEVTTGVLKQGRGTRFEILLPSGRRNPCFEVSHACRMDCDTCPVKQNNAEYVCWTILGKSSWLERGKWDAVCEQCPVCLAGNLEHYHQSGLYIRK
jgi:signal transduction histidine kinase